MHPSANFVRAGGFGVGLLYPSDKTTKAPIPKGLSGHRCYSFSANYGLSSGANLVLYHNCVIGRYYHEHIQMSNLFTKRKLAENVAIGLILQGGNQ